VGAGRAGARSIMVVKLPSTCDGRLDAVDLTVSWMGGRGGGTSCERRGLERESPGQEEKKKIERHRLGWPRASPAPERANRAQYCTSDPRAPGPRAEDFTPADHLVRLGPRARGTRAAVSKRDLGIIQPIIFNRSGTREPLPKWTPMCGIGRSAARARSNSP